MRKPYLIASIVLLWVFAFGLVIGVAGTALFLRHRVEQRLENNEIMPWMLRRFGHELNRELQFTPMQRDAVQQELQALHRELQAVSREAAPQVRSAFQDTLTNISAVLDPIQRDKLQRERERIFSYFRLGPGHGRPPPPGGDAFAPGAGVRPPPPGGFFNRDPDRRPPLRFPRRDNPDTPTPELPTEPQLPGSDAPPPDNADEPAPTPSP